MDRRQYIIGKLGVQPNASGQIHTYCPFHEDRKPSFSINADNGLWVCGSNKCGLRGNFPKFFKLIENIATWREALERLKDPGAATAAELLLLLSDEEKITSKVINPFPDSVEDIVHLEFLQERGIADAVGIFGLKFARSGYFDNVKLDKCLVVPVYDLDGEYRTFQVRYLSPGAYKRWSNPLNSPVHDLLYGGWLVTARTSRLWIVEGASDVWRLTALGEQAVGLQTKEASSSQLNRIFMLCNLYNLSPIVCLDSDVPDTGVFRLRNELDAYGLEAKVVRLLEGEDPGGISEQRFAGILKDL